MSEIKYDPDNIFLKIIKGQIPCFKIFETEHAVAFLDALPMTKGRLFVVKKCLMTCSRFNSRARIARTKSTWLCNHHRPATRCRC
jgi:diadenosine tetraphosphate (Ap4A) HIT family hydrolase